METIKVHFTSPKEFKIGAAAIKTYQGFTCYSHVAIEMTEGEIYHAAYGKVHFMKKEDFLVHNKICHSLNLTINEEQHQNLYKKARELDGLPYAYDELPKIVINDLVWNLTGKRPSSCDSRGFICSELLCVLLKELTNESFHKPQELIVPKDIKIFIEEHLL